VLRATELCAFVNVALCEDPGHRAVHAEHGALGAPRCAHCMACALLVLFHSQCWLLAEFVAEMVMIALRQSIAMNCP